MLLLRSLLFVALCLNASADGVKKERWVYLPTNFQVDERADEAIALLNRAAKLGYTHLLVADSKFSRLDQVAANYVPNVERVKAAAKQAGIEIVPSVFPVGYSNDALFRNPNLAEGLPVRDAEFVVKDGEARIRPATAALLPGGEMNDRKGWDFVDDEMVVDSGAMRSGPTEKNARLNKKVGLTPFRQYRLSVRIRSEGFGGGVAELKAIGKDGRELQWTNIKVGGTQDWTRYDVTFNSLDSTETGIYLGIWGGHRGTLWWDDAVLEECGPVNLLRRKGAPLTIRKQDGKLLQEGKDYDRLIDPEMGMKPWPGQYTAWHEPPVIRTKGITNGEVLKVSYFHPHIIMDEQVCGCVEEPEFQAILKDQAGRVADLWQTRTHLMAHDEWRVLGWDDSCVASKLTPGAIAAKNVKYCTGLLKAKVPGGRVLVWSDMFDPFHNAVRDYYLANGSLEGSWNGLEPGVELMNWNFGKRDESLAFFAGKGHPQVIAGFYDGPIEEVGQWLASAAKVKGVKGFMYTTWKSDYSQLEAVAKILDAAGW
jgi:hypothetical protein